MPVDGVNIPLNSVTFDGSQAGTAGGALQYSVLMIGQRTAAAAAVIGAPLADTIHRAPSIGTAITLGGRSSIIHRQALGFFAGNKQTELWIGLLDDDGAGVAATGTITVSGPATASGTIALYLGGVRITIGVTDGDSADDIAAAINAAINLALDSPVTSTVLTVVVTVTFAHKGLVGNEFDIRVSANVGEALPAGVGTAIVPLAGGTANPDLSALIAAMGDQWWQLLTHPYTDAVSLKAIADEMASRDGELRMIEGMAFTSATGELGTLANLGNTQNSALQVIIAQPAPAPPTPPMEFAAAVTAAVALTVAGQANGPYHKLEIKHALAPPVGERFTFEESNNLATDGIATSNVVGTTVLTQGAVTTYQINAAAVPSVTERYIETRLALQYLRFTLRAWFSSRYPRALLVEEGDTLAGDVQVITLKTARDEYISWFDTMAAQRIVQNRALFVAELVVVVDPVNPRQINGSLPVEIIKSLLVTSSNILFR